MTFFIRQTLRSKTAPAYLVSMPEHYPSSTGPTPLYARTAGRGSDLVLVHGWGMHCGVWAGVIEALVDGHQITSMDLPGHGYSRLCETRRGLAALSRAVAAVAPPRAIWIGWSLGGLVAQRLAIDAPERVARLVLACSSPCFVRRPDWSHAMDYSVLHQFAEGLGIDYRATLKRFIALEVHGTDDAREQQRRLRELVFQHGEPDPAALADCLEILKTTDLRAEMGKITCPTLLLQGRRDRLVPASVGAAMQALLPDARLHVFPRAGHAPFFSQLPEFVERLRAFLDD